MGHDLKEAAKWAQKAAKGGYAEAQYHLGIMYERGGGVPQDLHKAVSWYRKAAKQGVTDAKKALKSLKRLGL